MITLTDKEKEKCKGKSSLEKLVWKYATRDYKWVASTNMVTLVIIHPDDVLKDASFHVSNYGISHNPEHYVNKMVEFINQL